MTIWVVRTEEDAEGASEFLKAFTSALKAQEYVDLQNDAHGPATAMYSAEELLDDITVTERTHLQALAVSRLERERKREEEYRNRTPQQVAFDAEIQQSIDHYLSDVNRYMARWVK